MFNGLCLLIVEYIEEKLLDLKAVRERKEIEARQLRLQKDQPHIEKMKEILRDQLIDESTVEDTMNSKWALIVSRGPIDSLVPDKSEQIAIRSFFTEYYIELSEIVSLELPIDYLLFIDSKSIY